MSPSLVDQAQATVPGRAGTALAVSDLTVRFGPFAALSSVSFRVDAGERVAVIGPNGAGKSTLFNVLTGRVRPASGQVRILGEDTTSWRTERIVSHGVGRSFQQASVFPEFTVVENLQFALMAAHRVTRRIVRPAWRSFRREAHALADTVGIAALSEQRAGALSHGDERALELALSLALRPTLLLLDEPTAGMAPEETRSAMELIRRVSEERSLTVVFTEHDMNVVFSVAERVVVLAEGRVLMDGRPAEVRASEVVNKVYLGDD